MKESTFVILGLALLALWYHRKNSGSGLAVFPINQTPAQQSVYNALIPTVDAYGNIVNPTDLQPIEDVNSRIIGWKTIS